MYSVWKSCLLKALGSQLLWKIHLLHIYTTSIGSHFLRTFLKQYNLETYLIRTKFVSKTSFICQGKFFPKKTLWKKRTFLLHSGDWNRKVVGRVRRWQLVPNEKLKVYTEVEYWRGRRGLEPLSPRYEADNGSHYITVYCGPVRGSLVLYRTCVI